MSYLGTPCLYVLLLCTQRRSFRFTFAVLSRARIAILNLRPNVSTTVHATIWLADVLTKIRVYPAGVFLAPDAIVSVDTCHSSVLTTYSESSNCEWVAVVCVKYLPDTNRATVPQFNRTKRKVSAKARACITPGNAPTSTRTTNLTICWFLALHVLNFFNQFSRYTLAFPRPNFTSSTCATHWMRSTVPNIAHVSGPFQGAPLRFSATFTGTSAGIGSASTLPVYGAALAGSGSRQPATIALAISISLACSTLA